MADALDPEFRKAEQQVEHHGAMLRKELRLGDLVLSHVLYIIGLQWIGAAGRLGPAHIMYWVPAVLLFYIPSGLVVVHLSQEMPVEGGLYQWAKLRFGDLIGFLVALNLWATLILIVASGIPQIVDNLAYFAGPSGAWIADNKTIAILVAALVTASLMRFAILGLGVAKWVHNAGGFVVVGLFVAMLVFAVPRWWSGTAATAPVAFIPPAVSLLNLNLLGKMSFGAFCGFDGCAVFSAEIRDPEVSRTIRRSVWLSAPVIAFFYICGTACVLAFSRPAGIDLISPMMQVFSIASQGTPIGVVLSPLLAGLMICALLGGSSLMYNVLIRLPMVAGWDHLLPAWISRLHPRYKTPVGSIVCVGIVTFAVTAMGHMGVGAQEAFQFLNNTGLICWALAYMVMFAIPFLAAGEKPPIGVCIAAVSGFTMSLLYAILSIFPIVDVKDVSSFALKVSGSVLGINLAGALYFRYANQRRRALAAAACSAASGR